MKKSFITVCLMLLTSLASAETLLISSRLYIDYPQPKVSLHTVDTILFKYDEWSFSHEIVGPQTFYRGIDLSGLENDYIESLFEPEMRENFPSWLAALSKEQAEGINVQGNETSQKSLNNFRLFSAYNDDQGLGYIFVLEDQQAHQIQMNGDVKFYKDLIESIKER